MFKLICDCIEATTFLKQFYRLIIADHALPRLRFLEFCDELEKEAGRANQSNNGKRPHF